MKEIILAAAMTLVSAAPPSELPPTAFVTEGDTRTYYATYNCTAYEPTGDKCADGVYPREYVTVACNDSNLWNKVIEISGTGTDWDGIYYEHDTGRMAVMGTNTVDIFMESHSDCIQFGRRTADIYIIDVGSGAE